MTTTIIILHCDVTFVQLYRWIHRPLQASLLERQPDK